MKGDVSVIVWVRVCSVVKDKNKVRLREGLLSLGSVEQFRRGLCCDWTWLFGETQNLSCKELASWRQHANCVASRITDLEKLLFDTVATSYHGHMDKYLHQSMIANL